MMNQKIIPFAGPNAQFFLKSDEDCWKNLVNLIKIKLNWFKFFLTEFNTVAS